MKNNETEVGTVIYVNAQAKNDELSDGSLSHPFITVDAALNRAKAMAEEGTPVITILLSDGTYYFDQEITFDGEEWHDSKLVIKAASGASPVITSFKSITGFKEEKLNGINVWCADIPDGMENVYSAFSSSGERLKITRFPEEECYRVAGFYKEGDVASNDMKFASMISSIVYKEGEFPDNLSVDDDTQLHFFKGCYDQYVKVGEIDSETRTIKFSRSCTQIPEEASPDFMMTSHTFFIKDAFHYTFLLDTYNKSLGTWYCLENVKEALNSPGEYYISHKEKKIWYVPQKGESIESFTMYLPQATKIMTITNMTAGVTFEGVTFSGTNWDRTRIWSCQSSYMMDGAIKIEKSKNINFRNCTFSNIGITGLLIEQGSSDTNISKCKFYDIGANAIHIAGQLRKSDTTIHNITIADCTIQKYGQVYNSGCGILLRYAYDCEIIHNEISEGYYTGISAGWSWGYTKQPTSNIHIAYNHIHDIKGGFLSDGAGIYTLGQQEGTVIEYNHIHDIVPHCLGNGIYLDEGSSYILVRNNLVYNANQGCFYQHYGNENTVENNIFAFGLGGTFMMAEKGPSIVNTLTLKNNIIVSNGTYLFGSSTTNSGLQESNNLMWDYKGEPNYGSWSFIGASLSFIHPEKYTYDKYQEKRGQEKKSKIADPLFANPLTGDFQLAKNSPAFDMGFQAFDVSKAGPR